MSCCKKPPDRNLWFLLATPPQRYHREVGIFTLIFVSQLCLICLHQIHELSWTGKVAHFLFPLDVSVWISYMGLMRDTAMWIVHNSQWNHRLDTGPMRETQGFPKGGEWAISVYIYIYVQQIYHACPYPYMCIYIYIYIHIQCVGTLLKAKHALPNFSGRSGRVHGNTTRGATHQRLSEATNDQRMKTGWCLVIASTVNSDIRW